MTRTVAVIALFGCCALAAVAGTVAQTHNGRYGIIAVLAIAGDYDRALAMSDSLIEDYPTESWHYYRTKAQILRYQGRIEESLAVYDTALEVFPDAWWPHSHRCYYTALLTRDPTHVMDSCDKSVELEPSRPSVAYDRRAIVRAIVGDLAGAEEDLALAIELFEAEEQTPLRDQMLESRPTWLEELRAGRNPIGEQEIQDELDRH